MAEIIDIEYLSYTTRCTLRQDQLMRATINFVAYFMNLGDDKPTADAKVTELSTEVAVYLYAYVLGNKTPLIDGINASTLPFMDADAKARIISDLT